MLNFIFLIILFPSLKCEVHPQVFDQTQKWHNIQQQLVLLYSQQNHARVNKILDNQEFFAIQQQLGAIYLAQKRYQLGFGTAVIPSGNAVLNYVRKKTFLDLKTKELMPLYKKYVLHYQKKHTSGECERIKKSIKQLEALNLLHVKLFEQLEQEHGKKHWVDNSKISKIFSAEECIKKLPVGFIDKKSKELLSWITPVAGTRESSSKIMWKPMPGAIVICPDNGTVTAVCCLENSVAVFIKQHYFTYVVTGLDRCCVNVGDKLKQGEPLGFCAVLTPCFVEMQLWRDDIALDPEPYHKQIYL